VHLSKLVHSSVVNTGDTLQRTGLRTSLIIAFFIYFEGCCFITVKNDRYNVDQVPLPFVFDGDETIEEKGKVTVVIKTCKGVDGEKRQATLQVCLRARGSQPRPVIIFRGVGRFLKSERPLYDKVYMYKC
jgi:hypothetical protein